MGKTNGFKLDLNNHIPVTRELAKRNNKAAAQQDWVTPEAMRQRVLEKSGDKVRNCSNGTNKPKPESTDPMEWHCEKCGGTFPMNR
jgi:hypothetical protein